MAWKKALNITYKRQKINGQYYSVNNSKYVVLKYANDFVVLCRTLEDAKDVYGLLGDYLKERGLTLAPDKTKITHINDGFDFLGFNIRCYHGQDRDKVLIKASKDSIKSFKNKAKNIIRKCYPWNIEESIKKKLNYLINGTAYYWRIGSNKRTFANMDNYIYELLMRQLKRWYPNKSVKWMVNKHFKMSLHPSYNNKWTFTDPNTDCQVDKMSRVKIKYHNCIKYNATPYDAEYEEYLTKYKLKTPFECLYK